MARLYLVRHGETYLNREKCFQGGHVDAPLTNEGKRKTLKLGKFLEKVSFCHVASSVQRRAITTAELILSVNEFSSEIELTTYEALRELEFGDWEGKRVDKYEHNQQFIHLREYPHLYDASGHHGENYQEVLNRGKQLVTQLVKCNSDGNILVVSHGIILSSLVNDFQGRPLERVREKGLLENSSLSVVDCDKNGNFTVITKNRFDY